MFRMNKIAAASTLVASWILHAPAVAQDTQRIEITGSAIKRTDAETALPVSIINVQDLQRQGVLTVEQVLQRLASNQSNFGTSQAVGATTGAKAEADLRGLSGPLGTNANKTLVLLNGRRLANHSFDAAAVDLNAIPLAAVARVEVLRDGASALYGTDAIGGVVNFILRRDFTGVEVSAHYQRPEAGKAGEQQRAGIVAGFGSLASERFNVIAALDWRKQKVLAAVDRSFGSTGVLGTTRNDLTSGTSGTAFPGDLDGFEPSAPNCDPPFSQPRFTTPANGGAFNSCRYDFTRSIDLIPENEQITGLIRGSFAISSAHTLSAEYLRSNTKATARVAPAPTSHLMLASSPFYPVGAPSSDLDSTIPFVPGTSDPDPGVPTLGGTANWRQVPAGKRTSGDDTTTERAMLEVDGAFGAWDYRAAIGESRNKSVASVKRGYLNDLMMQQGVWAGVINPFGTHANFGQSAAGLAAIEAAQVVADTQIGKATVSFADFRVSGELFKIGSNPVTAAFGIERRNEKSAFEATDITAQLGSLGIDPDADTSGRRNVTGAFVELNVPVMKQLEFTLAARYDRYSDFGNTFNPKVGFKFQPTPQIALRGSANKGFRAPTLYEIYAPQSLSFTTDNYDDPVLCPSGVSTVPGADGVVCGQQVLIRAVGPASTGRPVSALEPEKSRAYSVGLVLEPMRNLSFTVDYWSLKIKNLINGLPEQEIFGSAQRYASRFVRCGAVAAGNVPGFQISDIDACVSYRAGVLDPIAFIDSPTENLGELLASGIDISANWRSGATGFGNFGVGIEGTYFTKYEYQRERNGARINAIGVYTDNAPVFRWQHVLTLDWSAGSWGANMAQRLKTKYLDQGGAAVVGSYALYDASLSFTGVKNLTLSVGVKNLLDEDPPRSVQATTFQRGYDPRFTDPLGRTFTVGASYKFF